MKHSQNCLHCKILAERGECCHEIFCECRVVYIEAQRKIAKEAMLKG